MKLVCDIQKIDSIESVIPLFLEGPAFAVFQQMEPSGKSYSEKIERVLLDAFAMDCFGAYENLRRRVWHSGESVDVYASDHK